MKEVIGYARVSTGGQDLGLQLDALQAAGVKRVFKDVGSGSLRSRPQLDACLEGLGDGDMLIVWRLDRLGRSLRHLLTVLAELGERGVATQRQMRETEVLAIEVKQYVDADGTRQTIVPRVIGRTEAARAAKSPAGRGATAPFDFSTASPAFHDLLARMDALASELGLTVKTGRTGRNYQPPALERGVKYTSGIGVYATDRGADSTLGSSASSTRTTSPTPSSNDSATLPVGPSTRPLRQPSHAKHSPSIGTERDLSSSSRTSKREASYRK